MSTKYNPRYGNVIDILDNKSTINMRDVILKIPPCEYILSLFDVSQVRNDFFDV